MEVIHIERYPAMPAPPPPVKLFTITINENEAAVLEAVADRICGPSPSTGPFLQIGGERLADIRDTLRRIGSALRAAR